jgi:hypothetical protein
MFYLAPHPKLERPRRGSPRMFTIDWVEKYFSRVRPWHVIAIWVPFSLYMGYRAFTGDQNSVLAFAGFFALGVLAWTLLEYGLHRAIFHFKPREDSEVQQDLAFLIHGIHHDYPWDADRLVMPPTVAALIAVIVWWPAKWAFGLHVHAWFAGLVMGYVWYDLTHYYLHHAVPTTAAGKWLRKYHLVHHFKTPNVRYGITTPLWDLVFGTYPKDSYQEKAEEMEANA